MKFTIYDIDTGRILRVVDCLESDASSQLAEGELLVTGGHSDAVNFVQDGQVYAIPDKPSLHHVFDYFTKQWVDSRTPETEWPLVRAERDRRLQVTDWTQLPDVPLATKEVWAVYRQALRDITEQSDPFNLVWPTPP